MTSFLRINVRLGAHHFLLVQVSTRYECLLSSVSDCGRLNKFVHLIWVLLNRSLRCSLQVTKATGQ